MPVSFVARDPTRNGKWQDSVGDHELLTNLAGATIFRRWTSDYKKLIYDSRILTTRNLVDSALTCATHSHGIHMTAALANHFRTQP